MPTILEDAEQDLTPCLRHLLERVWQEWEQLQTDIEAMSEEIERVAASDAGCEHLRGIPGVGPLFSIVTPSTMAGELPDAPSQTTTRDRLLTVEEVAAWLRVRRSWIYRNGEYLRRVRIGRLLRFDRRHILGLLRHYSMR